MKKIINGRRYDTTTSTLIGSWENDFPRNDFKFQKEELYKKTTGEFFVYGRGGGLSDFAASYGTARGWGEKIIPISEKAAKKWAEEKLSADEYEKIFEVEDELNSTLNMLIPVSLHEKLREQAEKQGKTQKELVVNALEQFLED